MTTPLTVLLTALLCGVAAAALTRLMQALAASDPRAGADADPAHTDSEPRPSSSSRWLRSGLHVVLAAAGGAGAAVVATNWAELVTFAVLAVACGLLMAIDLAVFRLPDAIVGPLYLVLLVGLAASAAFTDDWGRFGRTVAAGAVLLAFYFVLAFINPSGLGLGDVKLAGVLGMFLGWLGWPAVMAGTLAAFVINAAVALVLLAARRVGAKSGIAFGPAMVVGAVLGAAYFLLRTAAGV